MSPGCVVSPGDVASPGERRDEFELPALSDAMCPLSETLERLGLDIRSDCSIASASDDDVVLGRTWRVVTRASSLFD